VGASRFQHQLKHFHPRCRHPAPRCHCPLLRFAEGVLRWQTPRIQWSALSHPLDRSAQEPAAPPQLPLLSRLTAHNDRSHPCRRGSARARRPWAAPLLVHCWGPSAETSRVQAQRKRAARLSTRATLKRGSPSRHIAGATHLVHFIAEERLICCIGRVLHRIVKLRSTHICVCLTQCRAWAAGAAATFARSLTTPDPACAVGRKSQMRYAAIVMLTNWPTVYVAHGAVSDVSVLHMSTCAPRE